MSLTYHQTHLVTDCEEYRAVLDELRDNEGNQMLVVHFKFHEFSKTALRKFLSEWRVFRECVTAPLFAFCHPEESDHFKWERFVTLLGFREVEQSSLGDGRRIFVHFKNVQDLDGNAGDQRINNDFE